MNSFDILLELKTFSAGHDGISIKMLKLMKIYIVGPLVHIFNTSFGQGKVPDALKIARAWFPSSKRVTQAFSQITVLFQFCLQFQNY